MENVNSATTSSEWTQHTTRDGKCFWHNSVTNKSTWEKPIELQSDLEHAMSHTPWKEYTAADNKKYWYNTVTKKSVWNCPEEIVNLKKEFDELKFFKNILDQKYGRLDCSWDSFENKSVATSRLKTLFRIRGVTTKMKFDEVQNLLKVDKRFNLFSCLSAGEKKQALSEYQTQLKKQERDRERSQKSEARKLFVDALNKWSDLSITSILYDFTSIHADEWWVKLLAVSEREELFDDFVEENKKLLNDKQVEKREKQRKEIFDFFNKNPSITFETRWDDLVDTHLKDFPNIYDYEPRDVLQWWETFVLNEMQKVKDALQHKLNRAQRKRRDAFRDFLHNCIDKGYINARSSFHDFIEKYQTAPEYTNLIGIPVTTPRRIFEYLTEPLIKIYEDEKAIVRSALKTLSIHVTSSTTYNEFIEELTQKQHKLVKQISEANMILFFESLRRQAIKREKEHNSTDRDQSRRKHYKNYSASPYRRRSTSIKDRRKRFKQEEKTVETTSRFLTESCKEDEEEEEGEACEEDKREEGEADVEEGEEREENYKSNRLNMSYRHRKSSSDNKSYNANYEKKRRF